MVTVVVYSCGGSSACQGYWPSPSSQPRLQHIMLASVGAVLYPLPYYIGGGLQAGNYEAFAEAAQPPALEVTYKQAGHFQFLDVQTTMQVRTRQWWHGAGWEPQGRVGSQGRQYKGWAAWALGVASMGASKVAACSWQTTWHAAPLVKRPSVGRWDSQQV